MTDASQKSSAPERAVVVLCALTGAAFFTILAKGALFPELPTLGAILATLGVGASTVVWYAAGEWIGGFLHGHVGGTACRSRLCSLARIAAGVGLLGLWYWIWFVGESIWRAFLGRQ